MLLPWDKALFTFQSLYEVIIGNYMSTVIE